MVSVFPKEQKKTSTPTRYNDGIFCTCECGAVDIDCYDTQLEVDPCDAPYICNYYGVCAFPGCGNSYVDKGEDCDGGRGCLNCSCTSGYQIDSASGPYALSCIPMMVEWAVEIVCVWSMHPTIHL
eukprot:TRINITY_DN28077_c0_g1_i1.p2 TRINITY_DN28077_c0_g1~~TRINITY_DN28077_c0_g1_i1.p2  ORF type:complete len:125 (+),score=13.64 TRINITY_DN28077_c0_g1_i1:503-877(+)